jgi:carbon storage regulator CsrA
MLILTRYVSEGIIFNLEDGKMIELKILDIEINNKSKQVKIGLDAPKNINIVRDELTRRISKSVSDED